MEAMRARGKQTLIGDAELLEQAAASFDEFQDEESSELLTARRNALRSCMTGLDEDSVEVIAGFYWKRESCDSIADRLGRSVNAIRLLLSRLRKRLGECIQKKMEAATP
jgi:RNA polymerase sigma-70 factor (ECF subfamily)